MPYTELNVPDPIAVVADRAGLGWMVRTFIKLGAIAGLSSVILVMLLGQSRVFYTHGARRAAAAVREQGASALPHAVDHLDRHRRRRRDSPRRWFTVREAGSLVSIGTLLAFVIVSVGILVLRVREPNLKRPFKTPVVWFTALAGAGSAPTSWHRCRGAPGNGSLSGS